MDDPRLGLCLLTATAFVNVGLALLVGSIASLWLFWDQSSEWVTMLASRTSRLFAASIAWTLIAALALLWVQTAVVGDLPLGDAMRDLPDVVMQTHVGHAGVLGLATLLVLLTLFCLAWSRGRHVSLPALVGTSLCVALLLASKSTASHAGAQDLIWPVVIDWLHLVAIGVWSGIVLVAATVVLRSPIPGDLLDRHACGRYVVALSKAATWALVGVVATGAVSSWRGLGNFSAGAMTSNYGVAWLIKMSLVMLAVVLGAFNRFIEMPTLLAELRSPQGDFDRPLRRFRTVLRFEAVLLLAVLAVAAALSSSPPAANP